ncbi:MAG: SDR family oxidoreductase [Saprospiraceae bacterium]|nr:SDR family oxidoreductase [Saprospiraceae bacterium]MCF8252031.1 SDR family oxidoreductase [Saprospiraceae bacterium]MCF8281720.1 SDR family oxidoreductase [Bacteroidales bacterium]MCF8310392.1 SDR family oxidoreductase [Saprospiraceae bacterium]MCF8439770.1 SDR family oxidoreductase [Saprospiraceae bacterium]
MQNITGKTALITGGSKGIGYGIAESLLKEGLNVAITGRNAATIEAAAAELSKFGKVLAITADVRDFESQKAAVAKTLAAFGSLDVMVANAGVGHFANIADLTPEQWHETIDTNLTGVFYSVKASLEALTATKGYLITIASLAGTNFFPTASAYNASKFGLVGFTQAVMLDVRDRGIKVTTIMPGSVATHFNNHTPNAADAWKIQPEDLGQMTVDLLKMNPRTLPSKVEVRPAQVAGK